MLRKEQGSETANEDPPDAWLYLFLRFICIPTFTLHESSLDPNYNFPFLLTVAKVSFQYIYVVLNFTHIINQNSHMQIHSVGGELSEHPGPPQRQTSGSQNKLSVKHFLKQK